MGLGLTTTSNSVAQTLIPAKSGSEAALKPGDGGGCKYGYVSGKFGSGGAAEPITLQLQPHLGKEPSPEDVEWFDTGVSVSGKFDQVYAKGGQDCTRPMVMVNGDDESMNLIELNPVDGVDYYLFDVVDRYRGRQAYFAHEDYGDSVQVNFTEDGASTVFVEEGDFDNVQVTYKGRTYDGDKLLKRLNENGETQFGNHRFTLAKTPDDDD